MQNTHSFFKILAELTRSISWTRYRSISELVQSHFSWTWISCNSKTL